MRPWSYSRLSCYESCPLQYQYRYVEALPSPRPSSAAASRGSDIHELCEAYLKDELKMYPPEIQKVSSHAMMLKTKKAIPEQRLAVNDKWEPAEWDDKDVYMRGIIDVIYTEDGVVHVQDWKTGQIYDSHKDQLSSYVAIAAAHHPEAKEYRVRAIYIDQGVVSVPVTTTSDRVKPIRLLLDGRIQAAEADTIFPTRSGSACKWCDYSRKFNGPCSF